MRSKVLVGEGKIMETIRNVRTRPFTMFDARVPDQSLNWHAVGG